MCEIFPSSIFGQQDGNGENLRRTKVSDEIPLIEGGEEGTGTLQAFLSYLQNIIEQQRIKKIKLCDDIAIEYPCLLYYIPVSCPMTTFFPLMLSCSTDSVFLSLSSDNNSSSHLVLFCQSCSLFLSPIL
jgi:hypothetical protein